MIFLPRGKPVRQKVNPARINLPEAMGKLRSSSFTGYLRFDTSTGSGVVLFREGQLISALFFDNDENNRLIAYDAIARMFADSIAGDAILNIYRLSADLMLYVHSLLHGRYLLQGEELRKVDVRAQLDLIKGKALTACLRIYALNQTTLIFYEEGYPLGFVHEGAVELEQTADIVTSVACLPGAKLDLLEIECGDQIVLADLMGSADLGPIWQRTRKKIMQERQQQEDAVMDTQEQQKGASRQHIFGIFKAIAGNHIGKFGVTQVEKAFAPVGLDLNATEIELFYVELQRLARLVAGQGKILPMIAEMKKKFDSEK